MASLNPSGRLYNKVAIVTGAASGFGLAITQLFASHGCAVVAADLNEEALYNHFPADSWKQPASARVDGRVVGIPANVAERGDWDRLGRTARERFGGLDIVVNNAGTSYRNKVGCCSSTPCGIRCRGSISPRAYADLWPDSSSPASKSRLTSSIASCLSMSNRSSIRLAHAFR